MVAEAVAIAPWKNTFGPFSLYFYASIFKPSLPSTCNIVLHVSIGVNMILNRPAVTLPPPDFNAIGKFFV
jgi:hypothetical protein